MVVVVVDAAVAVAVVDDNVVVVVVDVGHSVGQAKEANTFCSSVEWGPNPLGLTSIWHSCCALTAAQL